MYGSREFEDDIRCENSITVFNVFSLKVASGFIGSQYSNCNKHYFERNS